MVVIEKYRNTALLQGVVDVFDAMRAKEKVNGGTMLQNIGANQEVDVALRTLDIAISDKVEELKTQALEPAKN
jgi:hypothetical protein